MTLSVKQHEARSKGIGGSDAPVLAGVDPYRQPLELYYIKRGEWPDAVLSDNESVHFGTALEPFIADEWSRRTGNKVRRDNRTMIHPAVPFMLGHIDRRVEGKKEGLEVKNRSWRMASGYGPSGTEQVLERDLIQIQHYMAVTGWEVWHLAVYFGGGDFRYYTIPRDKGLIDDLIVIETEFWDRVERGEPPDLDFERDTAHMLLDRLYPGTSGDVLTLPQEALHWCEVRREAANIRKQHEAVEKGATAHLKALMGDAAIGNLPDGTGSFSRKLVKRTGYTVEPTEYIDFRFRKKARGDDHD